MPITLKVRDVLDKEVHFIEGSKTVMDAIKEMVEKKVWSLVVTDRGLPVGVVTERDILRRCLGKGLRPEKVAVREVMSSPLITIGPDAPIGEAMKLLVEKGVRRIYVVEEGKIIGRVTQTGLLQNLLNVMLALQSIAYQF